MSNEIEALTADFNKRCDTLFKALTRAAARHEEAGTRRLASTDGRTRRAADKDFSQARAFREKAAQSLRNKISIKRI